MSLTAPTEGLAHGCHLPLHPCCSEDPQGIQGASKGLGARQRAGGRFSPGVPG